MFLGFLEIWSRSWLVVGFGINGEFVGSRTGALERIELNAGESVTHIIYGVGHHLKYKFLTLFWLEMPEQLDKINMISFFSLYSF